MNESQQVITIKQARELLGVQARDWTDTQVEDVINQLDFIATLAIRQLTTHQKEPTKPVP